ncbi:hypothetical protein [Haloprofundus salinisoli]|uniref:hypothetical protein n=1 Tax=Haloprofundus salinisoli TaxID=2876193 RepID=UPI001CCC7D48|nr:hypothetical protein [Haloprofundus salinisoli]
MPSWSVYNFECESVADREALMEWFETNHPVAFPQNRYSVFAEIETDSGTAGADYAWVDRYLYITVMGEPENLVHETADRFERVAVAEFDSRTETATDVTFVVDSDAGGEGEVAGVRFEGIEGFGGNDVMYVLAMVHRFRFRSYSAQSPTNQITPHPHAFTVVGDIDAFIDDLEGPTGVAPTEEGLALLRDDPADDDKYVYGETYGPVDSDEDDAIDGVTVVDAETGETQSFNDPSEVEDDGGLMTRIRGLFGG